MCEPFDNIPPTWKCVDCGKEFDNGPYGEIPEGFRTEVVTDGLGRPYPGRQHQRVVGNICKSCMKRIPPTPAAALLAALLRTQGEG